MSGIAELLMNLDFQVSGSDLAPSAITRKLEKKGASIVSRHRASNLGDCDVLVYSSAVREDNPELVAARERGIPVIRRAEMLGELIAVKETSIAVGGTHGKTTTASMVGTVLTRAELDPTLVVGGLVTTLDTNSLLGAGDLIVVEADEFDRSFLALRPTISLVTNLELEHTDCYRDLADLQAAFTQFANAVPFYGAVIAGLDSPGIQGILAGIKRPVITYGFSHQADFRAAEPRYEGEQSWFELKHGNQTLGTVELQVPGRHNVLNALGAAALGFEMGLSVNTILEGLGAYAGVRRRFEIKGIANDIMVVDDYAHHPTEVAATLEAARGGWERRIVAVFQPHLFTRTRDFYHQFAAAFLDSDVLIVSEIFPAREEAIEGVSGNLVARAAQESGHRQVHFLADLEQLNAKLDTITRPGDLVLTVGAGNIWRYGEAYLKHLQAREAA